MERVPDEIAERRRPLDLRYVKTLDDKNASGRESILGEVEKGIALPAAPRGVNVGRRQHDQQQRRVSHRRQNLGCQRPVAGKLTVDPDIDRAASQALLELHGQRLDERVDPSAGSPPAWREIVQMRVADEDVMRNEGD